MTTGFSEDMLGPEGEDWRVPTSELSARLEKLSQMLSEAGVESALIQHPIDLYYYAGSRQNGSLFVPAKDSPAYENGAVFFVRRSLARAVFEAGGDDAPLEITGFPRMKQLCETLIARGARKAPGMQFGEIPSSFASLFSSVLSAMGEVVDITGIVHTQREVKSAWEIQMMEDGADVQMRMFEAVERLGGEGVSELELVAAAEAISRSEGFGGSVQMRRYPLQCDRGVIVAGRPGGIPSFFDSAVGGTGPHPLAGMGSGFATIKANEPVLVDLVHIHRGYVVDATRMFVAGKLSNEWESRLEDMLAVKDTVVDVLDAGDSCEQAWNQGYELAVEMGYEEHLMGMKPDQSRFLGHSVGLQLDESPVVAKGFDRPLPVGGTMAIEPKVVYSDGSIGSEDTWVRDEEGMRPITADGAIPWVTEW